MSIGRRGWQAEGARRWTRRRFVQATLATGAATLAFGSMKGAAWTVTRTALAAADAAGLIVLPRVREVALVRPDGTDNRVVVSLQLGEFIADAALAPDRSRVAFGLFTGTTGGTAGGSDIMVAPADAPGERTVLVPRDRPGMLLAAPQWSPDGSALVFEGVGLSADNKAVVFVDWVSADGSGRRTIAQSGRYPSFSPDGRSVVYVKTLPTGDALWEQPLDGGEGREILPDSAFLLITFPRYSPDGTAIALTAVADTSSATPGQPGPAGAPFAPGSASTPRPAGAPSAPVSPKLWSSDPDTDPSQVRRVLAHGFPAEPFLVSLTGGEPRRLAPLPIDDAAIAWSPDGSAVAVSGANGLFLVGVADGSVRRVSENGSFGAIDWR